MSLCALVILTGVLVVHAQPLGGVPIWAANNSASFSLVRSEFTLRTPGLPINATLAFAAEGSPRPPEGTTQAKLLGAAAVYVNGILVTAGPGHNVPTNSQVYRVADITPYLREGVNAIGISSFFARQYAPSGVVPRVQASVLVFDAQGSYEAAATDNVTWTGWTGADAYFRPMGDAGISWYPMPNEYLDRRIYPYGWSSPGFASSWPAASVSVPWNTSTYMETGAPPATLVRTACKVIVVNATRQILDYGQEFMGGVNLTFPNAAPGTVVTVTLAEELTDNDTAVLSPMRTGNNWVSQWTLSGNATLDAGVHHHEFIQFRYAQIDGSPTLFTAGSSNAAAWVIQHPAGGDGRNPFEDACSTSTPTADVFGSGSRVHTPLARWSSSNSALDAVWNFSAYTVIATTLDVNVDGQTRERDVDVVDALHAELGQFYVFSPGDVSVQRRTMLEMFTNDTGSWGQWMDFKASTVMVMHDYVLMTGDTSVISEVWSDNDLAILADNNTNYNSAQFYACQRYFNGSGNNLLHFPADGSCYGSWACDPLVDWPVGTRDGYDCGADNTDDTVRSSFGALAYGALSDLAMWYNRPEAAARYAEMQKAVLGGLQQLNLRINGSYAYFVDGAAGKSTSHAAIHSTLYAVSAGAVHTDPNVAGALVAFMQQHGVIPSSCMMGRWWVTALARLGWTTPAAADLALSVLTSEEYPSWINMMQQGATCTMEAWRPSDKPNLDWAHVWCASPAFTIPGAILGALPLTPGWARWLLAPQPSSITWIQAEVPSPAGMLTLSYAGNWTASAANVTVTLTVLPGQTTQVCLAIPGTASDVQRFATQSQSSASSDQLLVDGAAVNTTAIGRMLCTTTDLTPGSHVVARITTAAPHHV